MGCSGKFAASVCRNVHVALPRTSTSGGQWEGCWSCCIVGCFFENDMRSLNVVQDLHGLPFLSRITPGGYFFLGAFSIESA